MPRAPLSRSISSSRTVIQVLRYTTRELSLANRHGSFPENSLSRERKLPLVIWPCGIMASMAIVADIVVVGLGAVGSAALYQAAKLGAKVIGIDRFEPPHDQGSSHGETRITRQAIGEGREFVPLVLRSNEIWEELEAATGRDLLTRNGGLVLASPGDRRQPSRVEFISAWTRSTPPRTFGIRSPATEHRRNSSSAIRSFD